MPEVFSVYNCGTSHNVAPPGNEPIVLQPDGAPSQSSRDPNSAALGCVSATGGQPTANEDESVCAVLNGEFYGFERQRQINAMRRRFDTVRALCEATAETEKDRWPTQLRYFERAKAIILGDIQNYELTSLQPLWVQLGMAVTERADLVLSSPLDYQNYDCKELDEAEAGAYDRQVRNAIFEALEAFLREYPRDFALHLRKTRPHFQYRSLFDLSKEDVSDFWHKLPQNA